MIFNTKSVSALIATILLIVVAVALVAIILTWGKSFTTNSVSEVDTFKDASSTYFIKPVQLVNGSLIFKNISTVKDDITITGYKIIATDPDTNQEIQYLETPIILSQGSQNGIRISSLPTDKTFIVQLYTSDGKYIDIKNIINTGSTSTPEEVYTFAKIFGNSSSEYYTREVPIDLIKTSDGGYLIVGVINPSEYNEDIWLLKMNPDGTLDWNTSFGGGDNDYSVSLIETSDNKYLILGNTGSYGAGYQDIWLLKINQDGTLDWNISFGGGNNDYSRSLIETNDNKYLVLGLTYSYGAGNQDVWLLKINEDGTLDWNKTFGGSHYDASFGSVIETDDNKYLVLGHTYSYGSGNSDIWLLKVNEDGALDWNKTFGGTSDEFSTTVIETSDHEYLILGTTESYDAGGGDIWVLKVNEDGTLDWNKTFGGSHYESFGSVIETNDNKYLVLGYTASYGAGEGDIWLLKVNQDGTLDWNKTFGGNEEDRLGYFNSSNKIIETSDNGYFFVGYTLSFSRNPSSNTDDIWLLKTDSQGNLDWNITYGGDGADGADYYSEIFTQTTDGGFLILGYTFSFGGLYNDCGADSQILVLKTDAEGLGVQEDIDNLPISVNQGFC